MEITDISTEVKKRIIEAARLPVAPDAVALNARLVEDCQVDSVALVFLMMGLEEAFGIEISETELEGAPFTTVGSLVEFVTGRVAARG